MKLKENELLFVADIGGTYTKVAISNNNQILFKDKINNSTVLKNKNLNSSDRIKKTLLDSLLIFRRELKIEDKIKYSLFSGAGVSKNNILKLSRKNLEINKLDLEKTNEFGEILDIINDGKSIAHALPNLHNLDIEYFTLNEGKYDSNKNICLAAVGTGKAECGIVKQDKQNIIIPSEAARRELAFRINSKEEFELIKFISKKLNRDLLIYQDLLSGNGIELIYEFLTQEKISANEISELAKNKNKNAIKTFEIFFKFLARNCKNQALTFFPPNGGLYLTGGTIIPNYKLINKKEFMKEFSTSSNSDLEKYDIPLQNIPITIILQDDINLYGLIEYFKEL